MLQKSNELYSRWKRPRVVLLGADHRGDGAAGREYECNRDHASLVATVGSTKQTDDEWPKVAAQIRKGVDDGNSRCRTIFDLMRRHSPERAAHRFRSNHADT